MSKFIVILMAVFGLFGCASEGNIFSQSYKNRPEWAVQCGRRCENPRQISANQRVDMINEAMKKRVIEEQKLEKPEVLTVEIDE